MILLIGLTFLIVASCSAAFVSSSPFQSPFSHFISWLFKKVLGNGWKSSRRTKIAIGVLSAAIAAATIFLVAEKGTTYQLLIFFPIVGVFAVTANPHDEEESYEENSPEPPNPWFGYPQMVVITGFIVFTPIAVATFFTGDTGQHNRSKRQIYISISSATVFILAGCCLWMTILNQKVQKPEAPEAEAIAWLLESSQDPPPSLLKMAASVATHRPHKVLLLSKSILILPDMIAPRLEPTPGGHDNGELPMLLSYLEHLSNFEDVEESILRNKTALKHPELRSELHEQLNGLINNTNPRLSRAAQAILSQTWEENETCGCRGLKRWLGLSSAPDHTRLRMEFEGSLASGRLRQVPRSDP